jgi:hypothetical protein
MTPDVENAAVEIAGLIGVCGKPELWEVARLKPHPLNPRGEIDPEAEDVQDLAEAIRREGLLVPLIVTPDGLIVAGHRRHVVCLNPGAYPLRRPRP